VRHEISPRTHLECLKCMDATIDAGDAFNAPAFDKEFACAADSGRCDMIPRGLYMIDACCDVPCSGRRRVLPVDETAGADGVAPPVLEGARGGRIDIIGDWRLANDGDADMGVPRREEEDAEGYSVLDDKGIHFL
jgi:hypothetical protein